MAWAKGQSGNPRGRKPGRTARGRFREQVEHALPEIVQNVLQAALSGDMQATKMILDRCIPALKPTTDTVAFSLPDGDLNDQGRAVMAATAAGNMNTEQGRMVMGMLSEQAHLAEFTEISKRLEVIEKWLQERAAQ